MLPITDESHARIIRTENEMGRTRDKVFCPCGHINTFYRWSWAGHGYLRCKGCKSRISYQTLEVIR